MSIKNILVTGGYGFIGAHLANQLDDMGYNVTVLDRATNNSIDLNRNINIILSDIRYLDIPRKYDVVYHLAALKSVAESLVYPEDYIATNVWGSYNIVKSFPGSRIVFVSSSTAAENKSVYGITKRCAEHFMNLHPNSVSVRLMNIFGEGQLDLSMAIPAFCYALKHNKKAIINGDGSVQRDFTYVKDLIGELINIGEAKIKGQTEIGYGEPIKILDLYKTLAKLFNKKPNYKIGPPRKGDMKLTCSKYKIKEPKFGLYTGLRNVVRYYISNSDF